MTTGGGGGSLFYGDYIYTSRNWYSLSGPVVV